MNPKVIVITAFAASYISMTVLIHVAEQILGLSLDVSIIIAAFVAAMIAGQVYGKRLKRHPSGNESWGYAAAFALLIAALGGLWFVLFQSGLPGAPGNPLAGIFVILLACALVAMRFFFPMGVRNVVR